MATTTTTNLAWAAGFLDGEGCITLQSRRYRRRIELRVMATQIVKEPLIELVRLFGGTIRFRPKQLPNRNVYSWEITSARAADCVLAIRPFLRVKRAQAVLAIGFWQTCGRPSGWNNKRDTGHSLSFTTDEWELRMKFFNQMRLLNHKGQQRSTK